MRDQIVRLTGHASPVGRCFIDDFNPGTFWAVHRVGPSQLNEILLALAYDTVTDAFFRKFFGAADQGVDQAGFDAGIARFEKVALHKYGNVKFAFKTLGKMTEPQLNSELSAYEPVPVSRFASRPEPLRPIQRVEIAETCYLGHLTGGEIEKRGDPELIKRLRKVRDIGRANLNAYLCSDEMDVYVATSMRDVEDFFFVGTITERLFSKVELKELKLRHFDPTQSYCDDRIEKGLVEALMLRRAKCTVYCAQTSETLGKDSELAVTLAMGKPVIAYVPRIAGNEDRYRELCRQAARIHATIFGRDEKDYYYSKLVDRHCKDIAEEVSGLRARSVDELENMLVKLDEQKFERTASTLKEKHPLGVQVELRTGVANGVLVVRTLTDCAQVLRDIITNTLEFDVVVEDGTRRLNERRTGCTYRLMVGDPVLTNSFWNFYKPWIEA